jgi:hypothetical protein
MQIVIDCTVALLRQGNQLTLQMFSSLAAWEKALRRSQVARSAYFYRQAFVAAPQTLYLHLTTNLRRSYKLFATVSLVLRLNILSSPSRL